MARRSSPTPTAVGALLSAGESRAWTRVVDRARALLALDHTLRPHLPAPLAPHCRVVNFRDGVLTLEVDSPVWAARARYLAPRLLELLREQAGARARRVQVRVRPRRRTTAPPAPVLSARGADSLTRGAGTISDPALRAALLRLAARGRG